MYSFQGWLFRKFIRARWRETLLWDCQNPAPFYIKIHSCYNDKCLYFTRVGVFFGSLSVCHVCAVYLRSQRRVTEDLEVELQSGETRTPEFLRVPGAPKSWAISSVIIVATLKGGTKFKETKWGWCKCVFSLFCKITFYLGKQEIAAWILRGVILYAHWDRGSAQMLGGVSHTQSFCAAHHSLCSFEAPVKQSIR